MPTQVIRNLAEVSLLNYELILFQVQNLYFSYDKIYYVAPASKEDACLKNKIVQSVRVMHYWQKIFDIKDSQCNLKIKKLFKLIKTLLLLEYTMQMSA